MLPTVRIVIAMTGIAALLATGTLVAQPFPFVAGQPPFVSAAGPGVLPGPGTHPIVGAIGADQIAVDQDGDGLVDEIFDLPVDIQAAADVVLDYRLSPTQEFLLTVRSPALANPVCGSDVANVEVYFHRLVVGTPNSMTQVAPPACLRAPLSSRLFFDPDRTAPLRTAVVVAAPEIGSQHILFVDLIGGAASVDTASYNPDIVTTPGGITFSPAGNAAFLEDDSIMPRWRVLDLCSSRVGASGTTPQVITPAGSLVQAALDISGNDLFAEVTTTPSQGTPTTESIPLTNCFAQPPVFHDLTVTIAGSGAGVVASNPSGIACPSACQAGFIDGTTVTLLAFASAGSVLTGWSGDCSGSSFTQTVDMTADRACTVTFESVALGVSKSGPASVVEGESILYTLAWENQGGLDATNVVLEDILPAGANFVAASNGGMLSGGRVTWNLGTAAAGASGQVTLEVSSCGAGELRNSVYEISSTEAPVPVPGAPEVVTIVGTASTTPVTFTIQSVPDRSPRRSGDLVTHTLTLTNPDPTPRLVRFGFGPGNSAELGTLIDDGGGTMDMPSPFSWSWSGTLDASATHTIVFTSRILDCFTIPETHLNNGQSIDVLTACGQTLASVVPPGPFALQLPVETELEITNLPAPTVMFGRAVQAAEAERPVLVQATLSNPLDVDQPSVALDLPLPPGLDPLGNDPFVEPTDGTPIYDPVGRTVHWSGSVPARESRRISLLAAFPAGAPCRSVLTASGSVGSCPSVGAQLTLLVAKPEPAGAYALGLERNDGLFVWEPGVDLGFRERLCTGVTEFLSGLARGAGEEVWVSGLPWFRTTSFPFSLDGLPPPFAQSIGLSGDLHDVAWDGTTSTAIFLEEHGPVPEVADITRYDPATGTGTPIATSLPRTQAIVVDPEGRIVSQRGSELVRFDPAQPGSPDTFSDGAYPSLVIHFLAIDIDGNYLISSLDSSSGSLVQSLLKVDRTSGAFSVELPDLGALVGLQLAFPQALFSSIDVASNGDLYLGFPGGLMARIERTPAPTGTLFIDLGGVSTPNSPGVVFDALVDLLWIEPGTRPQADLDVSLAAPANGDVGIQIGAQVTVQNLGPDPTGSVEVDLPLPAGMLAVAATASQGSCTVADDVRCSLGSLPFGGLATVDLDLLPARDGDRELRAIVSSPASRDPDLANNLAGATVTIFPSTAVFDLTLDAQAAPDPVFGGGLLTYSASVTNAGPDAAPLVTVSGDWLAVTGSIASVSAPGAICREREPVCTFTAPLQVAETRTVDVEVQLPVTPSLGVTRVIVDATGAGSETDASDNTVPIDVTVQGASDWRLEASAPPSSFGTAPIPFTFTVTDLGPSGGGGYLHATLPAGSLFYSCGGCSFSGGLASWSFATSPSDSQVYTLLLRPTGPGPLTVGASLGTGGADPNPGNDSASPTTNVTFSNENIDPGDRGAHFAWGENVGWIDLEAGWDHGWGIEVTDAGLDGFLWGENLGWCSLSCAGTGVCGVVPYGVTNDGAGQLAGFAWCENAGWLSFSCANTGVCASRPYGVTIDPATGVYGGDAWGENVGWVRFGPLSGVLSAETAWRGGPSGDGAIFADGFESGDTTAWSSAH